MKLPAWLSNLLDGAWPLWIIIAALAAIGLPLLLWALFGDRSRGRRRCPRCWYDLRGTPGLRCSECGYEARRERAFFRTRRRWRWVSAGVACVLVAGCLSFAPKIRRDGLVSILPTNVLLWLAPPGVTPCNFTPRGWIGGDWVSTELARRDAADTLNAADWQAYLSRKGIFRTRHAWPACEPVAVSVGFPNWASGCELVLDDVDHGVRHRSVINKWRSPLVQVPVPFPHEAFVAQFGRLSTADRSLKLHCAIQYHLNKSLLYDPPDTDVKFQIEIPITIVPALHDAIAPAAGPEYDEIMRRALKPACYDGERRKDGRTRFKLSFSRSADERLRSIAYGFQVDVLCNGSLIETIALPPPYPNLNQNDQSNWAYLNEMRLEVIDSLAHRPKYTFRVSGDSVLGLRDWDRTHYWAGTLEYNLHDLIRVE